MHKILLMRLEKKSYYHAPEGQKATSNEWYGPGVPWTPYAANVVFELLSFLPRPRDYLDYRHAPAHQHLAAISLKTFLGEELGSNSLP